MPPQPSFVCTCGYPLCLCEFSTPVKPPPTGWLPPTPASSAKKPAVSMWISAETTASPPLMARPPPSATAPTAPTMATVHTSTGFLISTPGESSATTWLPPTPADTTASPLLMSRTPPSTSGEPAELACLLPMPAAMRPAVAMPGSTVTGSSTAVPMVLSTDTSTLVAPAVPKTRAKCSSPPEIESVGGPLRNTTEIPVRCSDSAQQMISSMENAMDATIKAITSQYKADMSALQNKFDAMYHHCQNLSEELQKKDVKLALLKESDRIQKQLSQQQQLLARSTIALYKQHRTRFIMGQHSLVYRLTDTRPEVQQEMTLATQRIRAVQAKKERATINNLSNTVDLLAKKYDRYNLITETKVLNTRCHADGLPCIIPRELMGIWLFASDTDLTQEEITMYEFHLQKEVRGPPIYSPNLPRPTVNWTNLNKHRRKNLPDPELFPISSAPENPTYYTNVAMYKPADLHNRLWTPKECGCVQCLPHFGHRYGLMTDMGVIAMPDSAVHGYRWDDYNGSWVIATGF